jgi:tRNA 2-selenouridine synthase
MTAEVPGASPIVHPHQLEVQDFGAYVRVIDARSAAEYAEDHIPGALNVPFFAQDAAVATSRTEQAVDSARESSSELVSAMPPELAAVTSQLVPGDSVLVYCSSGGRAAAVWADLLRPRGLRVDVLAGGWPNYRRWVAAGLAVLPRALDLIRFWAPPTSGIEIVKKALYDEGQQVVDIGEVTGEVAWPGVPGAQRRLNSQAAFETWLLHVLRHQEADRPVWVVCGASLPEPLMMPPALRVALESAPVIGLQVSAAERARTWLDELSKAGIAAEVALNELARFDRPPSGPLRAHWQRLVKDGRALDALASAIADYVDMSLAIDQKTEPMQTMESRSLDDAAVRAAIAGWIDREPRPRAQNSQSTSQ